MHSRIPQIEENSLMKKLRKLLCTQRFIGKEQELTSGIYTSSLDTAHNLTDHLTPS